MTRLATGTRRVSRLLKWIVPVESARYASFAPTAGTPADTVRTAPCGAEAGAGTAGKAPAGAGETTPRARTRAAEPMKPPIRMAIWSQVINPPFAEPGLKDATTRTSAG
ncbi:hypothetical protein GCM10010149_05630 [Nonomuraea roseoviolacea subsp. roseoviolacea]